MIGNTVDPGGYFPAQYSGYYDRPINFLHTWRCLSLVKNPSQPHQPLWNQLCHIIKTPGGGISRTITLASCVPVYYCGASSRTDSEPCHLITTHTSTMITCGVHGRKLQPLNQHLVAPSNISCTHASFSPSHNNVATTSKSAVSLSSSCGHSKFSFCGTSNLPPPECITKA